MISKLVSTNSNLCIISCIKSVKLFIAFVDNEIFEVLESILIIIFLISFLLLKEKVSPDEISKSLITLTKHSKTKSVEKLTHVLVIAADIVSKTVTIEFEISVKVLSLLAIKLLSIRFLSILNKVAILLLASSIIVSIRVSVSSPTLHLSTSILIRLETNDVIGVTLVFPK